MQEKGNISIHTENIFPIIKKFLYSDHEIFLRELVSNAVDASQKIKRLADLGEYKGEVGELKITVELNAEAKTITIRDRGIGMTAEEIKKYINQIAFSGATEFVEKYKDKVDRKEIIGNFGLGFYSAFMVAAQVELISLSHVEGSQAARWICDGSTEFEITSAEKTERGTDIILHIAEDSTEFLDQYKLKSILEKYGKFLPVPVEFNGEVVNNTAPLWTKAPSELKDEDYLSFYKELYPYSEDPLFWIHLNVDYPFNLTGVLYFPKLKKEFEFQKNKIQLYSRQVFITDEVKDIVPEFLMLLHGVIDSPDIPLNVSRSFLQADANVKKINSHITKKVADKLSEIFNNDRKGFEEKWDDIGLFVKYGMISDEKFYEKAKDFCLLKNINGETFTLESYLERIKPVQTDKNGEAVLLYTNDPQRQDIYIEAAKNKGYDVLILDNILDPHYIGMLERKQEKVHLKRVDADSMDKLIEKDQKAESVLSEADQEKLKTAVEKVIHNPTHKVQVEAMSPQEFPVTIMQSEFMRRMRDMSAANGGGMNMDMFPQDYTVVVNANHPLIGDLLKTTEDVQEKKLKYLYDLAQLSQGLLKGPELTSFIRKSVEQL